MKRRIDIENAPYLILFIYSSSMSNVPIGMSTYIKAVKEYPEYFTKKTIKGVKDYELMPKLNLCDFKQVN